MCNNNGIQHPILKQVLKEPLTIEHKLEIEVYLPKGSENLAVYLKSNKEEWMPEFKKMFGQHATLEFVFSICNKENDV